MSVSDPSPAFRNPEIPLGRRLELAGDASRFHRLWAVMAQTDCGACGHDCAGYARALDLGLDDDPARCVPGGAEVTRALRSLLA